MKPLYAGALLVLSIVWGSAFLFNAVTVEEVPPLTAVAGRFIMSATLLAVFAALARSGLPRERGIWRALLVLAVINNLLPFTLITWAQQHVEVSVAAILNGSMPLFTAVIASAATDERLDFERAAGIAVGFAGVVALVGPSLSDLTESSTLGQLAVVAASVGYGASTVYARHNLYGNPVGLAAGQMLLSAAIMAPIALAVDRPFDLSPSGGAMGSWLALGLMGSGLAYAVFYWLIQRITATQASMVAYVIPLVATFLGWAVRDERLGPNALLGLALVLVGVAAANGGLSALIRRLLREPVRAET